MAREKVSTTTHALIGAGHMGGALLAGWLGEHGLASLKASEILIIDPRLSEAAKKALDKGAKFSDRLTKGSASGLKLCLLAIKPQMFSELGPEIANSLPKDTLVISIMAGIGLQELASVFGERPIIRAMPNTPAIYGMGITAYASGAGVSKQHEDMTEACLKPAGKVVRLDNERQIDMVTAISGSGPAYVFHLTEALEGAGVQLGLPKELAKVLARQTVAGAGGMLSLSDTDAAELRQNVTSKGGTTQAALAVLMAEDGLPSVLRRAVQAAYVRARELGGYKPN